MRVIYADLFFIINFCLDFLVLLSVGKLLHFQLKLWKLLLSSAFGSVYAVLILYLKLDSLLITVVHIAMSLLMCYIAFHFSSALGYIKMVILFYLTSLVFGGGITAAQNFLSRLFISIGSVRKQHSAVLFLLISGVIFSLLLTGGKIFARQSALKVIYAEVFLEKRSKKLSLLCDSGNLLRDPYSSLPVIIVNESSIKEMFTENKHFKLSQLLSENPEKAIRSRFRFIPISTPQGKTLIPGFQPDCIFLLHKNKKVEIKAIIATGNNESSYNENDGIIPQILVDTL